MNLSPEFLTEAEALRAVNIRVHQAGRLVAAHDWDDEIRRNQYSVSKSFTSTAVGFAVQEGLLSIDELVVDIFRDELPDEPSAHLQALTVRDLLTMSVGQTKPVLMAEDRLTLQSRDWLRYALAQPFDAEPGSRFLYTNMGPYLAGLLVQRRSGCDLVSYLMPRLFDPLDIYLPAWETDPDGRTFGSSGLFLTVSEVLKLAQFYLQRGQWNGKQLLAESWILEATRKQVENDADGYGYLFWRGSHDSYRMDGKYGQFGIVCESRDAVVAVNSESRRAPELLKLVMEEVVARL